MQSEGTDTFSNYIQLEIYQLVKNCEKCDKVCLSKYDISSSQSYTLMSIPQEGSLSMYEISKIMGIACSSMTRIVNPLVKKGLIQRGTDETDRRIVLINLTKKGLELQAELEKEFNTFFNYVYKNIKPGDLQAILNSMKKVNVAFAEAIKGYSDNSNME